MAQLTGATIVTTGGNACINREAISDTIIISTTPGGTRAATTVFTHTAAPNPIPTHGKRAQIMMMPSLMTMAGWKSQSKDTAHIGGE